MTHDAIYWPAASHVLHKPGSLRWAARQLGVNHGHLSRVLRGLRSSPRLKKLFNELHEKGAGQ